MSLSPPPSDPPRAPPSLAPNDFLLTLRPPSAVHPPAPYTPTSNFCLITPSLLLVNVSREPKQAKEGAFSPSPLLRRSTKANEGLSPFPQPNPHRKRMRGREGGEESDACQDLLPARKALPLPCYCTGGGGGEGEEDACLSLVPQLQLPPPRLKLLFRGAPALRGITLDVSLKVPCTLDGSLVNVVECPPRVSDRPNSSCRLSPSTFSVLSFPLSPSPDGGGGFRWQAVGRAIQTSSSRSQTANATERMRRRRRREHSFFPGHISY